ncbi:transcriptional regulator family: Fungal Specific TF [Paecilomyces variotii]|nr:transcriptional regulator family: Fungal Specific TF [Paecilomyces variotii]KAJ9207966.1 transcriptional regulator family: Fungal Specific TF [Paecilomyces variotii]KAJ9214852.1 transcriptional regulator family: Fungal Specific TF [Paecilomyces variotii]KAJ9227634.1 transcriptional regulator family: Fungal Specific TF [Paecilomyces variotii]KAJ9236728.1 transcriptional regulator family: Fungal Specific TF [Paecilomyces variotii]
MRSRTGCLTCRTRKLKCDERKPECTQCRRASRECRPSEGIVFRHQQNASMNKDEEASGKGSLRGFYSYKNTFDKDSVWLDIPKNVIFVDNSDPYAEDLEATLGASESAVANTPHSDWNISPGIRAPGEGETRGLQALSAAASHDHYPFHPPIDQSMQPDNVSFHNVEITPSAPSMHSPGNIRSAIPPSAASPSVSISSSNNNINFLLNPSSSLSPNIDPTLHAPVDRRESSYTSMSLASRVAAADLRPDVQVETEHEIAFLLRHFSESPGLWMDLFDLGTYFASYVPVKALTNPLLKYAACAYAAKQLGRVKGAKARSGGVCAQQASTEIWPDAANVDWYWYGAKYYEKAIRLLMKELQHDAEGPPPLSTPEAFGQWQAAELCEDAENARKRRRRFSNSRLSSAHSDEVLAATAILSVYEFLDATGPAWNRHLSGVKSLLDVAEVGMVPLEQHTSPGETPFPPPKRPGLSKARKATFWNFARQDYLAAFINECQTRLNTDDLVIWTDAGLQLDNNGFPRPSNNTAAGYPEGDDVMKEDMISNALIWILSKIVNFIAAGDNIHLGPNSPVDAGPLGISQQTLLERWYRLQAELDAWYNGLPETFRPVARLEPSRSPSQVSTGDFDPFPEIWYSLSMCASAMQHYHMARILLLINKPHESTARRSTVTNRLKSYRSIESEIRYHSYEICGISLSRPDGSVRINSLQPLFVSGQCLTESHERRTIVRLLREIEADLGWATEYRVQQLLKEWEWDDTNNAAT